MNIKTFVSFTGFYRSLAIAKVDDVYQYGDIRVTVVVLHDDGRMVLRLHQKDQNLGYLNWSFKLTETEFFQSLTARLNDHSIEERSIFSLMVSVYKRLSDKTARHHIGKALVAHQRED